MAHDINIKFSTSSSSGSGAGGVSEMAGYQRLVDTLNKLNDTLGKITNGQLGTPKEEKPKEEKPKDSTSTVIMNNLARGFVAGMGVYLSRFLEAESTAIMGRATTRGQFAASGIAGKSSENFGSYIGSLFAVEKSRQQTENMGLYEGAGIAGATALAKVLPGGGLTGMIAKAGLVYGGLKLGQYAGSGQSSKIEEQMLLDQAMATRQADASISQWKTAFSRFGMHTTPTQIVSGAYNEGKPIKVPLAQEFENQYGKSQNYNAILNNIVPYLTSHPLDKTKTGNLDQMAQNFNKAGISVAEFGRATMLASQYTAISGKTAEQFSKDFLESRARFNDAFTLEAQQNANNLMMLGYNKDSALNIANQAIYNPGIAGNVDKYIGQSASSFVKNEILGQQLGININESQRTGEFVGYGSQEKQEKDKVRISKILNNYTDKGVQDMNFFGILDHTGLDKKGLSSILAGRVKSNGISAESQDTSPHAGQQQSLDIAQAIRDGMSNMNVSNMAVKAVNVYVQHAGNAIASLPEIFKMAKDEYKKSHNPSSSRGQ